MNSDSGTEQGKSVLRKTPGWLALRLLSGMANGTLCRYFSAVAVALAATGPLPHDIYYGPEALEPGLPAHSPLLPVTPLRRMYSCIPLYFQFLLPPLRQLVVHSRRMEEENLCALSIVKKPIKREIKRYIQEYLMIFFFVFYR